MKISLIGFMGSGKTSVAKLLSEKLSIKRVEMDDLILEKSGEKSIIDIFVKKGESYFRELEIEVSKSLAKQTDVIISTGGGIVMNKINLDYLKINGKIAYLKTDFETILKRLKGDDSRPLFKNKEKAKELYDFRQKLYENYCNLEIETDGKSIIEVGDELIRRI